MIFTLAYLHHAAGGSPIDYSVPVMFGVMFMDILLIHFSAHAIATAVGYDPE